MFNHFFIFTDEHEQFEPVRMEPRLDIDRDSAIGLSIFTSGTCTIFS